MSAYGAFEKESDEQLERRLMEGASQTDYMTEEEYDEYSMNMALYGTPYPGEAAYRNNFYAERAPEPNHTGFGGSGIQHHKGGFRMDIERQD